MYPPLAKSLMTYMNCGRRCKQAQYGCFHIVAAIKLTLLQFAYNI